MHAHKKVEGDKLGPHCLLGYVQLDLSKYVGQKRVQVDFELSKSKVPKSFVQFQVTIVPSNEMDDLE